MMNFSAQPHQGYGHHLPHYHGFCHSCCHPMHLCCCGVRECRKIPKELLASAETSREMAKPAITIPVIDFAALREETEDAHKAEVPGGSESKAEVLRKQVFTEVIGGGCCVHLSVEYFPVAGAQSANFEIYVIDSDGIYLEWGMQKVPPGYHIKEGIITTRPGAILRVSVSKAIVRVRWCEVIAC